MMEPPFLLPPVTTFQPRGHSRSPSRSPTRPRITDDILSDLSPATTLEAFTSASGSLRASIEAATPTQRSFGIRAAIACKKLQEWVTELSAWQWPEDGSEGFETPQAKRRKVSIGEHHEVNGTVSRSPRRNDKISQSDEYWGSLPAREVIRYESRIYEIEEDMEDLDVEEIKGQVLNTHLSSSPMTTSAEDPDVRISSRTYARMDDFTAVVTATVLQALPALSRLMTLIDLWSVRLNILRDVPQLQLALDDAEIALKSGWAAIETTANTPDSTHNAGDNSSISNPGLSRSNFDIIRDVLQEKVTNLGRRIDHMLDTLEGRRDTIPEAWLDRMEKIEHDYGEWVVCGDRKVREGEWAAALAERRRLQEQISSALQTDTSPKVDAAEKMRDSALKSEGSSVGNSNEASESQTTLILEGDEPALESTPALSNTANFIATVSSTVPTAMPSSENREQDESKLLNGSVVMVESIAPTSLELASHSVEQAPARRQSIDGGSQKSNPGTGPFEAQEKNTLSSTTSLTSAISSTELSPKLPARMEEIGDQDVIETNLIEKTLVNAVDSTRDIPGSNKEPLSLEIAPPVTGVSSTTTDLITNDTVKASKVDDSVAPTTPHQDSTLVPIEKSNVVSSEPPIDQISTTNERTSPTKTYQPLRIFGEEPCVPGELHSMETSSSAYCPEIKPAAESKASSNSTSPESPWSLTPTKALLTGTLADQCSYVVSETEHADAHVLIPNQTDLAPKSSDDQNPSHSSVIEGPIALHSTVSSRARPSTPLRPSSSGSQWGRATVSPSKYVANAQSPGDRVRRSPMSVPKFGSGLANALRLSILPKSPQDNAKTIHLSQEVRPTSESVTSLAEANSKAFEAPDPVASSVLASMQDSNDRTTERKSTSPKLTLKMPPASLMPDSQVASASKGHSRVISNSSTVSGYATSDPSPEIYEAEPAEYFKPVLSPSKSESDGSDANGSTPTKSGDSSKALLASLTTRSPSQSTNEGGATIPHDTSSIISRGDPASPSPESAVRSSTPIKIVRIHRRVSTSSSISTVIHGRSTSAVGSPIELPSPDVTNSSAGVEVAHHQVSNGQSSPLDRIRICDEEDDFDPPNSPTPAMIKKRIVIADVVPQIDSSPSGSPMSPRDAPLLANVDVLPTPPIQHMAKSSEDQLQQQISEILENIPAHIRLTSEPETNRSIGSLQVKKRSSNAAMRPLSRAATPSFILAPAYGKGSRQRQQNGSPEIKLYHLSRSTGEAPIKLFVRLVGESGERVMVRVGGGWADLGEYLREYASHHSRRSDVAGKVEIQDLPPRTVSNNRNGSTTGHSSPISRPVSSLDRPMSNLGIHNTRKSVGEEPRLRDCRSPSTPNAVTSTALQPTPPSTFLSRASDDAELGLAGPKGRKSEISAENAAWVESMKEKVRQASAEKGKERERERERKGEFGALGRAGATKRLFRKSSGAFTGFGRDKERD